MWYCKNISHIYDTHKFLHFLILNSLASWSKWWSFRLWTWLWVRIPFQSNSFPYTWRYEDGTPCLIFRKSLNVEYKMEGVQSTIFNTGFAKDYLLRNKCSHSQKWIPQNVRILYLLGKFWRKYKYPKVRTNSTLHAIEKPYANRSYSLSYSNKATKNEGTSSTSPYYTPNKHRLCDSRLILSLLEILSIYHHR